ncbi:glycoside hydrolase/deacetylase [Dentipellis sp. KUC8613]|nr:glycoside hydrolase/deacetylase [Dentipellis sp. KUC8613]
MMGKLLASAPSAFPSTFPSSTKAFRLDEPCLPTPPLVLTNTRPMRALLVASFALVVVAQDHNAEQGEAQIKVHPPLLRALGNAIYNFPQIWTPTTILEWQNISDSIPTNIQPKGSNMGDFSNVSYTSADPDCWWTYGKCTTPKLAGLAPDVSSVPEPKTMGYGFDDGPNCLHNVFYDFLQQNNQKATMFFIASNVMDWPLEAQRALTDGHEICIYTWSHRYMTPFQNEDAFAELWYTMKAIKLVTGVTPTCWRDRIRAIANALNLQTIIWKYDSNDWRAGTGGVTPADVDANYTSFISNVASGAFNTEGGIMLMHELNNFTMSEAVKFYPQLQAAFSHIVPVGVALNKSQPYVETNYTLPSFAEYISGTTNKTGSANSSSSGGSSSSGSGGNNNGGSSSGAQKKSAAAASARPVVPALVLAGAGLLASLAL